MNYENEFQYVLNKAKELASQKVSNPLKPEQLRESFDLKLEEKPTQTDLKKIIDDIFKYSINTQNPKFLNQLFGGSTEEAWLAELMTAILNTSMATYEIAPLATLMEKEVLHQINNEIGFKSQEGLIVPGGSYANMLGINCARFMKDQQTKTQGQYKTQEQVFFVSVDAHYSSLKSLALLGLGTDNLIKVETDQNRKMCIKDLQEKIAQAKKQGKVPTCIVSTAGTTVYGAYDPINEINHICERENIWHHVDAAWGGLVLWSDRKEKLMNGISKVDSITLDFHKLMASTLTKGIFLTSKPEILKRANSGGGSKYIFHDKDALDIGTYAIQCGRKVDSLPLWLQWKLRGTEHYRNKIQELYSLQESFVETLKSQPQKYKLILDPEFMNICFQVLPKDDEDVSDFNRRARDILMENGNFMVNFSRNEKDGFFFRLVFNHWGVNQAVLEELLAELDFIKNNH